MNVNVWYMFNMCMSFRKYHIVLWMLAVTALLNRSVFMIWKGRIMSTEATRCFMQTETYNSCIYLAEPLFGIFLWPWSLSECWLSNLRNILISEGTACALKIWYSEWNYVFVGRQQSGCVDLQTLLSHTLISLAALPRVLWSQPIGFVSVAGKFPLRSDLYTSRLDDRWEGSTQLRPLYCMDIYNICQWISIPLYPLCINNIRCGFQNMRSCC